MAIAGTRADEGLIVAGKRYASRLLVGTGKYKDFAETRAAIEASGAEIVTVAIRRTNIGQTKGEPSLLEFLPPSKFTYLPNTAGCYTAQDAIRTLRLARELLDGTTWSSSRCSATRNRSTRTCPRRWWRPSSWWARASR